MLAKVMHGRRASVLHMCICQPMPAAAEEPSLLPALQVLTDTSVKGDVVKVTFADLQEMSKAA